MPNSSKIGIDQNHLDAGRGIGNTFVFGHGSGRARSAKTGGTPMAAACGNAEPILLSDRSFFLGSATKSCGAAFHAQEKIGGLSAGTGKLTGSRSNSR